MIANRLSRVIDKIISLNQGAFVKGRIAKNIVITQDVVHKIRKHKGKKGLMVTKIDLKKAYDRLEWSFINKALEVWGFSSDFRRLVRSCINSVSYSLLLNGSISGFLMLERGIRQGDHLLPLLFILSFEFLTRLIAREEDQSRLHGIKVA
ncbi:secreted RxLR effector protein 78-like [Ziziphus jujuba]|uniref:Secreted RxLR effector protein 78-like n=1 Tax=Ziziphus jujuba TaxID=326968 RepID=A0ABM3I9R4_ZIZJJ|nr:secreted RxLR effector protein 78-like [Ziziphus jujuba]